MYVSGTYAEGMRWDVRTESGHTYVCDGTEQYGGQNAGASPMELVLVGLCGCTGMDVVQILRKRQLDFTHFRVDITADRTSQHPQVFTNILLVYTIAGRDLTEGAVRLAIELSVKKYCSVMAILNKSARITYRIECHSATDDMVAASAALA